MFFLPLIERELRLALRRWPSGQQIRLLCAFASMVGAFWLLFVWSAWRPTAGFGRPFLNLLATVGYIGALVAGVVLAADSISREKREGTLDLLFLTDLHIRDVIFGHLFAKAVVPLSGFLAVAPTLEISVLVGGTSVGECIRLFLVWANTLLFSLASSLLLSTLCWRQRSAHASAVLGLLALTAAVPFLGLGLSTSRMNPLWETLSLLTSPTGPYVFANSYATARGWFWLALVTNQCMVVAFLGLAYKVLVRIRFLQAQNPASAGVPPGLPWTGWRRRRSSGDSQQLLNVPPTEWLAARKAPSPVLLWLWSAVAMVLFLRLEADPFGNTRAVVGFVVFAIFQTVLKIAVASQAVYAFGADRRSGALESLLSTDVNVGELTSAMHRVYMRRILGPVLLMETTTLLLAGRLFIAGNRPSMLALLIFMLMLPLEIYCLSWIGLFQGLSARTPVAGLGTTLLEIVFLPWAWFFILSQIFVRSSIPALLVLWAIPAHINHAWFLTNAKALLLQHFRTLALKPFGEKNPRMESDWSPINWEEETTVGEQALQ